MKRKPWAAIGVLAFVLALGGASFWMIHREGDRAIQERETLPNYRRNEALEYFDQQGTMWFDGFDSNADGRPEVLAYVPRKGGDTSGGTIAIDRLVVMQLGKRKGRPLLSVDHDGVRDSLGRALVPQVSAAYGYRADTSMYEGRLLIHLALLDSAGNIASDELTFAWDADSGSYVRWGP